ncbi:CRISPR-associated protein Cas4 [Acidisphaera sp. S103]|uniref:CRISPR-associated protein Cas4 n=1 Tax=Acidisphaera sp. S103 TaxID=1747223 RepID=UPI00131BC454|nr:CRISPR-associated protein Cas4 [Acidisphaera sp. S103]
MIDPIAISALQHWSYCPRQAALIHLDDVWSDNPFTMRGNILHERVDQPGSDLRGDIRVERALPLFSRRLNLSGRADAVEFHQDGRIVPVEYKSGRRKARAADDLQLCAQALCLEEMFGCSVPEGAIFHAPDRRRRPVVFTAALRATVGRTVADIAAMLASRTLPPPVYDARCKDCSLLHLCLPELPARPADLFTPAPEAACASF